MPAQSCRNHWGLIMAEQEVKLDLSGKGLREIRRKLSYLTNVTTLDLSANQLSALPPELLSLTNLKTLYFSRNVLSALPPELAGLTNLTELNLSRNRLSALPPELFSLTNLTTLDLSHNLLSALPPELSRLTNLTTLNLSGNQLSALPPELAGLTNLKELHLIGNQLSALPPELARLTNLTELYLSGKQLSALPPELAGLPNLTTLYLNHNQLSALPPELARLTNLTTLDLSSNQLSALPPELAGLTNLTMLNLSSNQLGALPPELAGLTNLTTLNLSLNQLKEIPPELGRLTNLTTLDLSGNKLSALPPELARLTNLTTLSLSYNGLGALPPELGRLTNLTTLNLAGNQLSALPPELGSLTNLKWLYLSGNQLTALPPELAGLTNLTTLNFYGNQLSALPPELGRLTNLTELHLDGNPLTTPPPEIVAQGRKAILSFLRQLAESAQREWVSKLLLVGEGGVGKTCLLRRLRGEGFRESEETTHGIEIRTVELPHPDAERSDVTMRLNAWDFGGQDIYHATHQFFLSNRSLFLLVWNARVGYEASKIDYWLETIKARAPESPVMLVATRIDERAADLPLTDLQRKFPRVLGLWKVSNKDGTGIDALRDPIARTAADLPLMGERWPTSWLDAANAIRARNEQHIRPQELWEVMRAHRVMESDVPRLAQWLHDLGDILYFHENPDLSDLVILKPQWVSQEICKVLDCPEVRDQKGIFTREDRDRLWSDLDLGLQEPFLRMMEQFDLSYRTLENQDLSLVVELLPFQRPDYEQAWKAMKDRSGCKEITMRFELSSMQPGIPTWFIARSHRFTQKLHWRYGAVFGDRLDGLEHLGLIEAFPPDRVVQLTVRGPNPYSFFNILRNGLELTLDRFPGMEKVLKIPCPGHDGQPCPHHFTLTHLERAMSLSRPEIECPEGFAQVSVLNMLFGLDYRLKDEVIGRLDDLKAKQDEVLTKQDEALAELRDLRALAQRGFLRQLRALQRLEESHCPAVFVLRPKEQGRWRDLLLGQRAELQFYCDAPGQWHPTASGGRYDIDAAPEWLQTIAPYVRGMVKILKYAAPLAGPVLNWYAPDIKKLVEHDIDLMKALVEKLPDIKVADDPGLKGLADRGPSLAEGAALRALRTALDKVDAKRDWGGLRKVLTPEGDYLWLCEQHAQEYRVP
jgi:small GTP-binding protein